MLSGINTNVNADIIRYRMKFGKLSLKMYTYKMYYENIMINYYLFQWIFKFEMNPRSVIIAYMNLVQQSKKNI